MSTAGQFKRAQGARGHFFWGSLPDFKNDPIAFFEKTVHDYGDACRLRFGPVCAHLFNHPEYAEEILSKQAENFDKKTRSVERIRATCGDSLLSANTQAWQRHRKLIQPIFQPKNVMALKRKIDQIIEPTLDQWLIKSRCGEPINIVDEMMKLVITISAQIMFSASVASSKIEAALEIIIEDTWRRLEAPLDASMISPIFHKPAFKKAVAQIDQIVFDIIAERKSNKDTNDDLLSLLLRAHEDDGELGLSDQELRDAAVTLLLAGHETTANALSWAFYNLAQARENNVECANMEWVFAETIRLYPSIWILERRAKWRTEIGGFEVPKGSSVLISPYLMHRHPAFWLDPLAFQPSRFDPENMKNRPRNAYLPFGLGAHRCIGLNMAKTIALCVLERAEERFKLTLLPNQKINVKPSITLRHSGPILMCISD